MNERESTGRRRHFGNHVRRILSVVAVHVVIFLATFGCSRDRVSGTWIETESSVLRRSLESEYLDSPSKREFFPDGTCADSAKCSWVHYSDGRVKVTRLGVGTTDYEFIEVLRLDEDGTLSHSRGTSSWRREGSSAREPEYGCFNGDLSGVWVQVDLDGSARRRILRLMPNGQVYGEGMCSDVLRWQGVDGAVEFTYAGVHTSKTDRWLNDRTVARCTPGRLAILADGTLAPESGPSYLRSCKS